MQIVNPLENFTPFWTFPSCQGAVFYGPKQNRGEAALPAAASSFRSSQEEHASGTGKLPFMYFDKCPASSFMQTVNPLENFTPFWTFPSCQGAVFYGPKQNRGEAALPAAASALRSCLEEHASRTGKLLFMYFDKCPASSFMRKVNPLENFTPFWTFPSCQGAVFYGPKQNRGEAALPAAASSFRSSPEEHASGTGNLPFMYLNKCQASSFMQIVNPLENFTPFWTFPSCQCAVFYGPKQNRGEAALPAAASALRSCLEEHASRTGKLLFMYFDKCPASSFMRKVNPLENFTPFWTFPSCQGAVFYGPKQNRGEAALPAAASSFRSSQEEHASGTGKLPFMYFDKCPASSFMQTVNPLENFTPFWTFPSCQGAVFYGPKQNRGEAALPAAASSLRSCLEEHASRTGKLPFMYLDKCPASSFMRTVNPLENFTPFSTFPSCQGAVFYGPKQNRGEAALPAAASLFRSSPEEHASRTGKLLFMYFDKCPASSFMQIVNPLENFTPFWTFPSCQGAVFYGPKQNRGEAALPAAASSFRSSLGEHASGTGKLPFMYLDKCPASSFMQIVNPLENFTPFWTFPSCQGAVFYGPKQNRGEAALPAAASSFRSSLGEHASGTGKLPFMYL